VASTQIEHPVGGEMAAALSTGVVRLCHEYTGRGPTKARTVVDDDLVTVVLEDLLTKGERSLVEDGEASLVLTTRSAYQSTMRSELIALIEETTGRKVRAFMSANHIDPDVAVEFFMLEPV
jgi:uncharacterized protein YbcI